MPFSPAQGHTDPPPPARGTTWAVQGRHVCRETEDRGAREMKTALVGARRSGRDRDRMVVRVGRGRWRHAVAVGAVLLAVAGCVPARDTPAPAQSTSAGGTASASATATETPTSTSVPSPTASGGTVNPAPAPAPGAGTLPTKAPVALDQTADFGTGVVVRLDGIDKIVAQAQGPGEVTGPALAFRVAVTNSSSAAVDLGAFIVNLTDAKGGPGILMLGAPAAPLTGMLAAGATATGTYVFAVGTDADSTVRLEASYSTQAPTVVFSGAPAAR
jgi:hypothetical protein